ncbi:sigma-B regulation protein RsbQ [Novosphingobium sp. PhB55]|jgi:sigma-B regulation protein RsbQ|uniref:alpha/beta fold hydrolase n=1 Tax=unclassified Novosphingobium TaxID=2644732 RepID=UPI001066DD6B|nr:alpha/beta hydrolase [Novosphingobium sp. PhB55]TDW64359.1 sigma-B regulation protein RsbQ [Novosphingobium sp. PhB55]
MSQVFDRQNARISGSGTRTMLFAHGFGCDQNMWRFVAPAFEDDYRVVLFDHIGFGGSDLSAYDQRHRELSGYADDVIALARAAGVENGIFVGHSVSAMIGIIAAQRAPELFDTLVLVGPSPRYIDDGDYVGGFAEHQIAELLEFLDSNHLGWSQAMAPTIMGNPDRPELGQELTDSFCRTDPAIAKQFARTTFLSDNREDLANVKARTLILQCRDDVIAPLSVGEFVHDAIPGSELVILEATGHCPNLSAPEETIAAIKSFL